MSDVRQSGEAPGVEPTPTEEGRPDAPASGISSAEHLACALHEVSNALTVVLGWLDVAEQADPEDLKRAIEVAREHARRGQVIARRSIGAEVESSEGEQSAADILRFAATSILPQAQTKGVSIESRVGAGVDGSLAFPDKVLQVLTNLLMNGLSFSPSGGALVASVQREGDVFKFEVSDEGPGVEVERRPSLFSSPTSTRPGGLGIGLPHSRQLAREAGGDLRLLSSERGARFQLIWPTAPQTRVRSSAPAPSSSSSALGLLLGARILVVEDDAAISALVEMSFASRGAEVIVVSTAEEFVNVLRARPVLDLVLLDLSPVDEALGEALDSLEQAAPGVPIILMSGQPSGIPREAEGRFASWVRKPFDMEELLNSSSALLRTPERPLLAGETGSR